MSITDIATRRLAPGARPSFGVRRVSPVPGRAQAPRVPSPVSQAAGRYWQHFQARLSALLPFIEARLLTWTSLLLLRLGALSPPRLPGLLWRQMKSRALAMRRSEARAHQAAVRALLWSEAPSTLVRAFAYISTVALIAAGVMQLVPATPSAGAADPAPVAEWIQVAKPFPAFSLPLPELAESGADYSLRRHAAGGGRQDILTWGDLKGVAPNLTIEIYRPGSEWAGFYSAAGEIAARLEGAEIGAITPAGTMETKFGTVSLVAFSLGTPARRCLGFARTYRDPQLQILGWHCVSGSATAEREVAACALDRLSLLSAGSEPKLRELFARAELRRNFCGQRSHLLTPTPRLGPSAPAPEIKRGRLAAG